MTDIIWKNFSKHFSEDKNRYFKKHGNAVLFMWALNVGAFAPNPDQRTFREKSFGISKAFTKIKLRFGAKFLCLPFSERKVRKEVWNAVPTYLDKLKKHGIAVLFMRKH